MFEMKKLFLLLEVLYCGQDEIASKQFIKKFHQLTDDKHDIAVKWLRKKVKSLFPLKTFNLHSSCKIYKGTFSYGDTYIGETNYNIEEVGQNIFFLTINQNWPHILLKMKDTLY